MALPPRIILPDTPALAVGLSTAAWLDSTGEIEELSFEDTAQRFKEGVRPLLCHGPGTAGRLSLKRFQCFDVLELFAFVRPLDFCVPTPRGLGDALGIDVGPGGVARIVVAVLDPAELGTVLVRDAAAMVVLNHAPVLQTIASDEEGRRARNQEDLDHALAAMQEAEIAS